MKSKKTEIGSEFWSVSSELSTDTVWEKYIGDKRFYLSGRTALYEIIADIKATRECKTAYLPDYCCESMVEPFIRHGINVEFYNVYEDNGLKCDVNPNKVCDIVFTVDYFGYNGDKSELPSAVHIHDVTHSLLSRPTYNNADYYFASFRKWAAVAGAGMACKINGSFLTDSPAKEHNQYIEMRNQAYALKKDYIEKGIGEKQKFLELFSFAESLLDEDYVGYKVDEKSLSTSSWIEKDAEVRIKNAEVLLAYLKNSKIVDPIYKTLNENDVPLFVPVLIKNGLRDKLRKFLIENAVYCPVHWPAHSGCENRLYKEELSLICDQRYNSDDMIRQIELIKAFEERFC